MSWSNVSHKIGAIVSDASIAVARIVTGDATDTTNSLLVVKAATGETTQPLGVTTTPTSSADREATIALEGVVELEVNGNSVNIATNDLIVSAASGIGVKVTTADVTPQLVLGIALAPSTADGDVIPVLISRQHFVKGTA